MIIHRIAENFRKQDWLTVSIEFLIVVLGIYVGLQVDDWNDRRKDRILEQEYLERLFTDMNGSVSDFLNNVSWDIRRLNTQYLVLQSLRNGSVLNENEFKSGLALVGIHNPSRRRWGTVNELVSTGKISIIQDVGLRTDIAAADAYYKRNEEIVRTSQSRINSLRSRISERFDIIATSFDSSGKTDVVYDFSALTLDTNFINTFSDIHLSSELIFSFSIESIGEIEKLRNKIAVILGREIQVLPSVELLNYDRPWRLEFEKVDGNK